MRLAQAVTNLLNNAAKYTERGGRIGLSVTAESSQVTIRVRDNGIGIEAELLPRIFDLFTQADRSLERSQGGLGIGLSVVKSLVEMHGGTVTAASEGTGRGSVFEVSLPLLEHVETSPDPVEPTSPRIGCRILVVDDNVGAAHLEAKLLQRLGNHEVRVAHDGPSALRSAADFRPQIVLLDIGLPQMNGYEVARRMRNDPDLASALLVAVTGYGADEDRRRSLQAGFDLHLVKPPSIVALRAIFRHPKVAESGGCSE